jgi:FtsZ-interacting cell division protein YlmF
MKNFTSLFGKKDNNDYDKYYDREDDMYDGDDDVTTYGENKDCLSVGSNAAPVSLKVVKPKSYSDGPSIADHLSAGSTVVLNIESLDKMSAIRLIDFLMGAVHVLGGDMKSVTKTTLVFAPRNVGVTDFENLEDVEEIEEVEDVEDYEE